MSENRKTHTVTVVRNSDHTVRQFKVVQYHAKQRQAFGRDAFGTRYFWPYSEFTVRAH